MPRAPSPPTLGEPATDANRQLAEQCEGLKEALRNAESDLRASRHTITILERTQRLDREEIHSPHDRIEALIAELAALKAKTIP